MAAKDIDPAFVGIGQKPGLDVWRIVSGASPKRLDASEAGKFLTGDAYVVLKTNASKTGGLLHAVHYWLGKTVPQEDANLAAAKAVDVDLAVGGKTPQYRELQGHESDLFLSYFRPCIIPRPGSKGVADSTKVEPQLWQVKGRRFIRVRALPFVRSALSHADVFVVNNANKKLYQFNGANAGRQERGTAFEVTQAMKNSLGGSVPVAVVEDGDMTEDNSNEFWELFGGFAPIAKKGSSEDDVEAKSTPPTLLSASTAGLVEEGSGTLRKIQLEVSHCYILDAGSDVFVWFGRLSSTDDRRAAAVAVETLLVTGKRPPSTRVVRMTERFETPAFKASFSDWPQAPVLLGGDGGAKKGLAAKAGAKSTAEEAALVLETPTDTKVWRLNGKEKIAVTGDDVGKFYSGDCYVVQFTYTRDRKQEYLMFFWIGKSATPEERTVASGVAARMADTKGGHVTLVRVVQGREPDQFFSLFKGNLFFFRGGLSASYKKFMASRGDDTYDPAGMSLFQVRPRATPGVFTATQMPLVAKSLNSSDCLLLLTPGQPFLWEGKNSGEAEKTAALAAANILKPGSQMKPLVEGKETTVFWGHVGGKGDYPQQREGKEGQRDARLFQLVATPAFKVIEVPGFVQEDLLPEDVMVLDTFAEVFVWVGSSVPDKEKREALDLGLKYVELVAATEGRSKDTTVVRVSEGYEPPMFVALFPSWDPMKIASFVDPYERKLASLLGRLLELSDAAKRRLASFTAGAGGGAAAAEGASSSAPAQSTQAAAASAAAGVEAAAAAEAAASAASQRKAALAALQGSIAGVAPKPTPAPVAAPAPVVEPAAPAEVAEDSSMSSQRAAALAALSGTLTAEKKKGPGFRSASTAPAAAPREEPPAKAPEPEPAPAAAAPPPVAAAPPPAPGTTFPLAQLRVDSTDPAPGIDISKRETYLSDADFEAVFGMPKDKFYTQPKWKQDQKKRSLGLF